VKRMEELSQEVLARPLAPRPSLAELAERNRRRRRRHLSRAIAALAAAAGLTTAGLVAAGESKPGGPNPPELAAYVATATQIPDQVLEDVGLPNSVMPPTTLHGQARLAEGGKPAVVFVGAGYCPFCAVERWALVIALSKFGNFSKLGQEVSSASTDVYPGLKSWSFAGSSYSSRYLSFAPEDTASSAPVAPPKSQPLASAALAKYDVPPYASEPRSVPFVDIGNRYVQVGSSASPAVLQGLSLDRIASDLANPASPVAQTLVGSANYLIAAFCSVTAGRRSPVCNLPAVARAEARLKER
jgi:Domain of unknown function (DUF929)